MMVSIFDFDPKWHAGARVQDPVGRSRADQEGEVPWYN